MSTGQKFRFKCAGCGDAIVAEQTTEGTVPMIIDCQNTTCNAWMGRDTGKVNVVGKSATHKLVADPDKVTDKLKVIRCSEASHGGA